MWISHQQIMTQQLLYTLVLNLLCLGNRSGSEGGRVLAESEGQVDVARSVGKEILELYPSRVRLYEQTVIQPTIISVFKHPTRLVVNNSFQLISVIVYIHTYLCTRRGTLSFHPHLKLQSIFLE